MRANQGGVADRPVRQLSVGQRQLVSVARALAGRPKIVLLDVCDRIVVLNLGRVVAIGTPPEIERNDESSAYLGRSTQT